MFCFLSRNFFNGSKSSSVMGLIMPPYHLPNSSSSFFVSFLTNTGYFSWIGYQTGRSASETHQIWREDFPLEPGFMEETSWHSSEEGGEGVPIASTAAWPCTCVKRLPHGCLSLASNKLFNFFNYFLLDLLSASLDNYVPITQHCSIVLCYMGFTSMSRINSSFLSGVYLQRYILISAQNVPGVNANNRSSSIIRQSTFLPISVYCPEILVDGVIWNYSTNSTIKITSKPFPSVHHFNLSSSPLPLIVIFLTKLFVDF